LGRGDETSASGGGEGGSELAEVAGASSARSRGNRQQRQDLGGCRRLRSVRRGGFVVDLQRSAAEAHLQSTVDEDEGVGGLRWCRRRPGKVDGVAGDEECRWRGHWSPFLVSATPWKRWWWRSRRRN